MRLLLDTHVLLWWLSDDLRLGQEARGSIADPGNDVVVSVVSLWEIVVKQRVGKLEAEIGAVERAVDRGGFERLAITPMHLEALACLPTQHRDPFDHLLIAQAMVEGAALLSADPVMTRYPVRVVACGAS